MIPTVNGIPVLLPGHSEENIPFHYHEDPRFGGHFNRAQLGEVVWKELPDPLIPMPENPKTQTKLLIEFDGCFNGPDVCIHKGTKLHGCKVCPAHGLPIGLIGNYQVKIGKYIVPLKLPINIIVDEAIDVDEIEILPLGRKLTVSFVRCQPGDILTIKDFPVVVTK